MCASIAHSTSYGQPSRIFDLDSQSDELVHLGSKTLQTSLAPIRSSRRSHSAAGPEMIRTDQGRNDALAKAPVCCSSTCGRTPARLLPNEIQVRLILGTKLASAPSSETRADRTAVDSRSSSFVRSATSANALTMRPAVLAGEGVGVLLDKRSAPTG